MRIGIIQFPGSNCERETKLAVQRAGMEPVEFLWNQDRDLLNSLNGYIIVGGFSYEDRSRAGIIAALDPIMQEIKLQSEMGKPVLGICNGAQILVETGLVPGLENNKLGIALTENKRVAKGSVLGTGFYNAWVHMRLSDQYQRNAFTRFLTPHEIIHLPIAHAEGRFVMTEALLQEIEMQGLNVFQYCDAQGVINEEFPINPNGSLKNIAAISNKAGNVMAMMPHPERTVHGDPIFHSMRQYIEEHAPRKGWMNEITPLHYYPRPLNIPTYTQPPSAHQYVVELMITDNQALTVQNTLKHLGINAEVRRYIHWEIESENAIALQQIKQSGVLYNDRKESLVSTSSIKSPQTYLVRAKEDIIGLQKTQVLMNHFNVKDVCGIKYGILWQFSSTEANMSDIMKPILHSNIIANPYAHDCYRYQ